MQTGSRQLLYLISYDITSNRTRTKAASLLIAAGYERLQLSVFISFIPPWDNEKLWQQLTQMLRKDAEATDRLFCLPVHKKAVKNMRIIGSAPGELDYICGNVHTLVL